MEVKSLQQEVEYLRKHVKALEDRSCMAAPEWAKPAARAAKDAGIIEALDGHSYDTYRTLFSMYHKGFLASQRRTS